MRPDKKQAMVDVFVKEFNALEEDLRCDAEAKAELHQRAEDFREKLWTISDERKDEAENERTVLIENRWVEDHLALIANLYIGAMQLEVDRYIATKQVLVDFVKDASEVVLDDTVFSSVKVPVVDLTHTENLFQDIARPKHEAPTVLLPANILRKAGQPIKRDRVGTAQKKTSATISEKNEPLSDAPASTIVAPVVLASTIVAPGVTSIEGDAYYHALTNASNAALAVVGEVDFTVTSDAAAPAAAKETKDKKGKVIIEVPAEVKGRT